MKRTYWTLVTVLNICAGFVAASPPRLVYACSCIQPSPPAEALANASAVFVGTVTALDGAGNALFGGSDSLRVTFDVDRVWKGPHESPLIVVTSESSASCGFTFQQGLEYLVYTSSSAEDQQLHVSLCSRTMPANSSAALEDFDVLGSGTTPQVIAQPEAGNGGNGGANQPAALSLSPWIIALPLALLGALIAAGAVIARRVRR